MLDFRIDTFLTASRLMNFTRTAEELHITQPAVSQHIRFLEEYYGTRLFLYEGKKLKLTAEGELLRRMASAQKHDSLYLKERLSSATGNGGGIRLHFGVTLTIGEFVIAGPLAKLLHGHPEISVQISMANTQELLGKIERGEIEFAIMEGNFSRERFDSVIYSRENFIPVCSREYRFRKEIRRMEDLTGERLILREEGSGTRELLVKDLERRNLSVHDFSKVIEIGDMSVIKSLAAYGCGISFLYEAAVKRELAEGTLKKIELEDFSMIHDFSFVWQKDSFFGEDYRMVFEELRSRERTESGAAQEDSTPMIL